MTFFFSKNFLFIFISSLLFCFTDLVLSIQHFTHMGFKFLFLAHLLSEEIQTIAFVVFPLQTEQLGL